MCVYVCLLHNNPAMAIVFMQIYISVCVGGGVGGGMCPPSSRSDLTDCIRM